MRLFRAFQQAEFLSVIQLFKMESHQQQETRLLHPIHNHYNGQYRISRHEHNR
jgi:hypothetical protein